MKPVSEMTQGELAAYVDTHLCKNGIHVVLSGGACVAVYSDHIYVSKDLDFVAQFTLNRKKLESAMNELGFLLLGRYYHHPQTPYYVEFISGPPAIGQDPIENIHQVTMTTGTIRIISPTDSVKDRLAAYFYWGDQQGLEQAVLVANNNSIDIDHVRNWSVREGKQPEFKEFIQRLKNA